MHKTTWVVQWRPNPIHEWRDLRDHDNRISAFEQRARVTPNLEKKNYRVIRRELTETVETDAGGVG